MGGDLHFFSTMPMYKMCIRCTLHFMRPRKGIHTRCYYVAFYFKVSLLSTKHQHELYSLHHNKRLPKLRVLLFFALVLDVDLGWLVRAKSRLAAAASSPLGVGACFSITGIPRSFALSSLRCLRLRPVDCWWLLLTFPGSALLLHCSVRREWRVY